MSPQPYSYWGAVKRACQRHGVIGLPQYVVKATTSEGETYYAVVSEGALTLERLTVLVRVGR